jgi:hypothetical protein
MHICNPSTCEAEAGGFSRPVWAIEQDPVSKNKSVIASSIELIGDKNVLSYGFCHLFSLCFLKLMARKQK